MWAAPAHRVLGVSLAADDALLEQVSQTVFQTQRPLEGEIQGAER